jgi:hypothetical protein
VTGAPVRGTQSFVGQMAWVFLRPSLTGLEAAWRWLIGVPLLWVCWQQGQRVLADVPVENTGLASVNWLDPWTASIKVAESWEMYQPHVVAVLRWLVPAAALAWMVISGVGRNLVLMRMERGLRFRPFAMIVLQGAWLALLLVTCWSWWASINWAAARHIGNGSDPDLVGYFIWVIFLSLGFFSMWALVSWLVTIAPMLSLLENRSVFSALGESLRLGKTLTGKLVEINLVMGIVKLMLLVVGMVFSAVLLPFSQQVGMSTLHVEWMIVSVCYLIVGDYFQVVRLKGYVEMWRIYRGAHAA